MSEETRLTLRLPVALVQRLAALAKEEERTLGAEVRVAIRKHLEDRS